MKKAALVLAVALLAIAMLAVPVFAAPPLEKKVPVAMQWKNLGGATTIERRDVDTGISHRIIDQNWGVKLYIDGSTTPLEGTADVTRVTLYRYSKDSMGVDQVVNDDYVVTFASEGGGFVGNVHILVTDYVSASDFGGMVHALLHGTGSFEGQTINAGVKMSATAANMLWEGYLSKP